MVADNQEHLIFYDKEMKTYANTPPTISGSRFLLYRFRIRSPALPAIQREANIESVEATIR